MTTPTDNSPGPEPTEPAAAAEPGQQAVDSAATATEDAEEDTEGEDPAKAALRREAARYRRELRGVETERDSLQSRLTALQRTEVERLATQGDRDALVSAGDFWLSGADLADQLDDDGQVAPDKVRQTVAAITADRPHWRSTGPVPSFDGGVRAAPPSTSSWSDALRDGGRAG